MAKAASLRIRPAWEKDSKIWAALTAPVPGNPACSLGCCSEVLPRRVSAVDVHQMVVNLMGIAADGPKRFKAAELGWRA